MPTAEEIYDRLLRGGTPTLGELDKLQAAGYNVGPLRAGGGGGGGMPSYQLGQSVGPEEAADLSRQGYRLQLVQRAGSLPFYTITEIPSGAGGGGGGGGGGVAPVSGQQTTVSGGGGTVSGGGGTVSGGGTEVAGEVRRELPPWMQETAQDVVSGNVAQRGEFGEASREARDVVTGAVGDILAAPGYSPEEIANMRIGTEEAARLSRFAIDPVVGAANRAQQELETRYAATGNFNPGINATVEEIQREQGRQAAEAALKARLGVSEANRRAGEIAAAARQQGQQFGTTAAGNIAQTVQQGQLETGRQGVDIVTGYPETATSETQKTTREPTETTREPTVTTPSQTTTTTLPIAPGQTRPGSTTSGGAGVLPKPAPVPTSTDLVSGSSQKKKPTFLGTINLP